jgi:hypothetical protein
MCAVVTINLDDAPVVVEKRGRGRPLWLQEQGEHYCRSIIIDSAR